MIDATTIRTAGLVVGVGVIVLIGAVLAVLSIGAPSPGDDAIGVNRTTPTQSPTGTEGQAPSATPTDQGTVRTQYAEAIERLLVEAINEYRETPLSSRGSFAAKLDRIAQSHSKTMATTHQVGHTIYGETTMARFKMNDIALQCAIDRPDGTGVYNGSELELVGHIDRSGMRQVDIANAFLAQWTNSDEGWKLTMGNADTIGVGIVVVEDSVYATVIFC
ncbi:MAG: CAP domain-containing protein [Halobacteriales archaeon]|nr:CAP domain-containing protein [Halobacteriales archaeon]